MLRARRGIAWGSTLPLAVSILLGIGGTAKAQGTVTTATPSLTCVDLITRRPPKAGDAKREKERQEALGLIDGCVEDFQAKVKALASAVQQTADGENNGATGAQALDRRTEEAFLKKWIGALTKHADAKSQLRQTRVTLEGARDALDDAMDLLGLRQWISAELVPGVIYGDAPHSNGTSEAAFVRLQSRHISYSYDEDRNLDFSLAGGFGIQPTLTLTKVTVAGTKAASPPEPMTQFKDAFVWEARPQAQVHCLRNQAELSIGGRAGQAVLFNVADVDQGVTGQEITSLFNTGASRTEWFFGAALSFRILQTQPSVLHQQKDADVPLDLGFTYKYDLRFRQDSSNSLLFDRPEHRLGVKLGFNLPIKKGNDPVKSKTPATTAIGFTIEHEFALYKGGVPAATKFTFRGDTNLFKLLKGI